MTPNAYRRGVTASRLEVLDASHGSIGDPDQPIADAHPANIAEFARPLSPATDDTEEVAGEGVDPEAMVAPLHHEQALAECDHISYPGQPQFRIAVTANRGAALKRPALNLSGGGARGSRDKAQAATRNPHHDAQPRTSPDDLRP